MLFAIFDEINQISEFWKLMIGSGVIGTIVGLSGAALYLWNWYRRDRLRQLREEKEIAHADNATTSEEWRRMAKESWQRTTMLEKKVLQMQETHQQEIRECHEVRLQLQAQNMRQQDQLDLQKKEIEQLKGTVSRLSESVSGRFPPPRPAPQMTPPASVDPKVS